MDRDVRGGGPVKIMDTPSPFWWGRAQEATEVWEMGREGPVAIPKRKRHTHAAASPPYMAAGGIMTVATDLRRRHRPSDRFHRMTLSVLIGRKPRARAAIGSDWCLVVASVRVSRDTMTRKSIFGPIWSASAPPTIWVSGYPIKYADCRDTHEQNNKQPVSARGIIGCVVATIMCVFKT
eukprot:2403968-Pyramimonas_sp.AAC.1